MLHNTNHLYKISQTYYFRVKIPIDLRVFFKGKEDFKRSLKTKSLTQARRLLKVWDFKTEEVFTTMRLGMLTNDQIRKLAEDYLHNTLREDEACRSLRLLPLNKDQLEAELQQLEECRIKSREALTLGKTYFDQEIHSLFLQEKCPDLSPKDPQYFALERELLKQDLEIFRVEIERARGNYNNGYDDKMQVAPLSPSITPPAEEQCPLLSKLMEKYIADYRLSAHATENSIKEYEGICHLFLKVIGDKEVKSVTRDNIRNFLTTLKKLPKQISKKPQFRGKSITQILEMGSSDTLHETTIQKYMSRVHGLFKSAVTEGWIDKNPAEGLTPRKSKTRKQSEERKAFDKEDLDRLVKGLVKVGQQGMFKKHPERFWIPLIGLYSGMRENEICQLHIDDVIKDEETGIWYFNVEATESDDKSVKTAASRRRVSIHPQLQELGFLEYYQKIKDGGFPRVWMNLTKTSRGYHRRFASWFLGVKSGGKVSVKSFLREHVTGDPLKNFHSLRHTFVNALKQKLISEPVINELIGHSQESLAMGRYGKGFALQTLLDAMIQVDFGINLGPLKKIDR